MATLQVVLVGGGGGGATRNSGGGGGAGEVVEDAAHVIVTGSFAVVVGPGGAASTAGTDSTFDGLTAHGGGLGGNSVGGAGGSAGGSAFGSATKTNPSAHTGGGTGFGSAGGGATGASNFGSSGGGGAGGVGVDAGTTTDGGAGGPGRANSISGSAVTYGGGGGGGTYQAGTPGAGGTGGGGAGAFDSTNGGAGTVNAGGGGGGAGDNGAGSVGGAGGSGIVIIRYTTGLFTATGGTITTVGGDTVHTFTSDGTFTATVGIALAASPAFGFSTSASLTAPVPLSASPGIRVGVSAALYGAAALAASPGLRMGVSASLTAPATFAASPGIRFSVAAMFGAAAFGASPGMRFSTVAALTTGVEAEHAAAVSITLRGVDVRTRIAGLSILDVINDAPDTASLTIDGTEDPENGDRLRVVLGLDAPRLLFAGALQVTNLTYEGLPDQLAYPCTAVDDSPGANRRRPFGAWVDTSATTVVIDFMTAFAPGIDLTHVQAGLPTISIELDGSEGISGGLKQVTDLIGGYFYVEDNAVHLFQTETSDAPDAIDSTPGRFLDDPPITITRDTSQLMTRAYGKGHGEAVVTDVAALEPILPIADAVMFTALGGKAIARSQILAYTGVQLGGSGSLVGPGAAPSVAPLVAAASGSGLGSGVYGWGYSDVTALGESLVSPLRTVTLGVVAAPGTAPTVGAASAGAGVDDGSYDYGITFTTPSGETTLSPISGSVTAGAVSGTVANPTSAPTASNNATVDTWGGDQAFKYSYSGAVSPSDLSNITAPSPASGTLTTNGHQVQVVVPYSTNPAVLWIVISFDIPAAPIGYHLYLGGGACVFANNPAGGTLTAVLNASSFSGGHTLIPTSNSTSTSTAFNQIPLTIPLGGAIVTGRTLYRRFNGTGTFQLAHTFANNTTTGYLDTTANASLGAAAPSTNTATANQATVTGIAIGPATTTSRNLYRTAINGTQLKLVPTSTTFTNNTVTGPFTDSTPDGSLGANAPTADTSGLTQPQGQVNAGSTSLPTASAAPFPTTGGWALIGSQAVRYTGVAGNALTGIPSTGPGALINTARYGEHVDASPALTGVAGNARTIVKGTAVNIWVQRDDLAAQAAQAAIDAANGVVPTDGVYEGPPIVDERRGEASLIAVCDAALVQKSWPIVTVTYACRDPKTRSGKTVHIDLPSPSIGPIDLTIQEVTIDQIGVAVDTLPRFSVTASTVRYSLEDILRRLIVAQQAAP